MNTKLNQYFLLDPQHAHIKADKLTNETLMQVQTLLGKPQFPINKKNSGKLETWFEQRFTLSEKEHENLFQEYFGIDLRLLDKTIAYDEANTHFSVNSLYHNERFTNYVVSRVNQLLSTYSLTITNDRKYEPLLYCFLKTVEFGKNDHKSNYDFIVRGNQNIHSLYDLFLLALEKHLDDVHQMHYKDNMAILLALKGSSIETLKAS